VVFSDVRRLFKENLRRFKGFVSFRDRRFDPFGFRKTAVNLFKRRAFRERKFPDRRNRRLQRDPFQLDAQAELIASDFGDAASENNLVQLGAVVERSVSARSTTASS